MSLKSLKYYNAVENSAQLNYLKNLSHQIFMKSNQIHSLKKEKNFASEARKLEIDSIINKYHNELEDLKKEFEQITEVEANGGKKSRRKTRKGGRKRKTSKRKHRKTKR